MNTPDAARALERAVRESLRFLDGLDTRAVGATATLTELRQRTPDALQQSPMPADDVIAELVTMTEGGLHSSTGGRFFGWVMGGALPAALAADWLTSAWDQNAALYTTAPAAAVIEEVAGRWMLDLLDLPRTASFAFTTGCQMAHVTGLAAARHAVLQRHGWDVHHDGLHGAPPIRILTSEHRHGSIDRAVRLLGLGSRSLQAMATDATGRIAASTLSAALAEDAGPTIVVLDAADLNIAAVDDCAVLVPMAHAAGAWVHVDGAFGLFARASGDADRRALLAGVELADSWSTDAHKWLNVPFDCGISIIRDRDAHRAAMTLSASYISFEEDARNQMDWNPEWSRRARGITMYAALRELGRDGVASMVDRCCEHCTALTRGLGALPGGEVVWESHLNQGLVRFLDPTPGATDADHDRRTLDVIAAINATGDAFFSGGRWHGRAVMRISVVNWRTTDDDVRRTIAAAARVLKG